jgi:hypothetical protein
MHSWHDAGRFAGKGQGVVKEKDFVAIFHSVHRVLKAEKALKEADADFLLIPVPRQLSSDCGLALRIAPKCRDEVFAVLADHDLLPAELYQKLEDEYRLCG